MKKFQYTVTKEDTDKEVRTLLRHKFNLSSKMRTKIKYGKLVFLNGDPVEGWIKPMEGDLISIALPLEKSNFEPEDIPIDVIYEDEDLLIINKSKGITVHPTKGCPSHTLANAIMKYMLDKGDSYKIRFVNRLDTDTSGLIIVAKNSHSQFNISNQMKAKTVEKSYKALVNGIIEQDDFTIDLPIGRPSMDDVRRGVMIEGGCPSLTHVKVLKRFPKSFTLVELKLETGRTHQIRVHLSHIGHPIVGDWLYGGNNPFIIDRQALHAYKLSFIHPFNGEKLILEAPLPDDILKAIEIADSTVEFKI